MDLRDTCTYNNSSYFASADKAQVRALDLGSCSLLSLQLSLCTQRTAGVEVCTSTDEQQQVYIDGGAETLWVICKDL